MTGMPCHLASRATQKLKSGKALLVCAYEDEAKFKTMHLQGAISFNELKSQLPSLAKNQEIVFYWSLWFMILSLAIILPAAAWLSVRRRCHLKRIHDSIDMPIEPRADDIERQAVLTRAMPPGNATGITDKERDVLAAWLAQGG